MTSPKKPACIQVYCRFDEKRMIKEKAEDLGVSMSQFMMDLFYDSEFSPSIFTSNEEPM